MAVARSHDEGTVQPASGPRDRATSRLGEVLRWEGVWGLARRAARRLLGRLARIERVHFFTTDLTRPLPTPPAGLPVECREATVEDIERHAAELRSVGLDPREARRRLEGGDVGYLGLVDGRLAHVAWDTARAPRVDEIGMRVTLEPGDVCGYEMVTLPEWRGSGSRRRCRPSATAAVASGGSRASSAG
jgi:hypothetical protein